MPLRLPSLRYRHDPAAITFRRRVLAGLGNERSPDRLRVGNEKIPISEHGDGTFKLVVLVCLLVAGYSVLVFGQLTGTALLLAMAIMQPIYLISAMGIAHDASHGAAARTPWLNRLGTMFFDLVGVNGYIWYFDHVTAHHNAPNVSKYDATSMAGVQFGWIPGPPLRSWHRYQHLYAPVVYALASLFKIYLGDFLAFTRTRAEAYVPPTHAIKQVVRLVVFKIVSIFIALGLPLLINRDAGMLVAGYFLGHATAGLLMGSIFQPTHTNEWTQWPLPAADGKLQTTFEEHIFATTADFSIESFGVTWLAGGLNIHAIHHLFPGIAHMQLREAARLVKEHAPAYGLTYRTFPTWSAAVASHFRALYRLGRASSNERIRSTPLLA